MNVVMKSAIRTEKIASRLRLGHGYAERAALRAAQTAFGLILGWNRFKIGLYWPIRGEIDTRPLAKLLRGAGRQCLLPRITAKSKILTFGAWQDDAENEIVKSGSFKIPSPPPQAELVIPDCLLVPLSAFDRAGHRVGYGAGYYDRSIADLRAKGNLMTCGYGYALQETTRVPSEEHDVALDRIVTEHECIVPRP